MKVKALAASLALLAIVGVGLLARTELPRLLERLSEIKREILGIIPSPLPLIEKEISAPPPLRLARQAPAAVLTKAGVIRLTNAERENDGIAALRESAALDADAELKLQDMFAQQYFAHVSPAGYGPAYWAGRVGYEYILIGENLALGNFESDRELVDGWMNSPGHRANILNPRYEEIGVAVGRGSFEGRTTWLAVQVFGKPLSSCSRPDENLKTQIDAIKSQLDVLSQELDSRRREIEAMSRRDEHYREKVDEYNALVAEYNQLVEGVKSLIAIYNDQVQLFNACASG